MRTLEDGGPAMLMGPSQNVSWGSRVIVRSGPVGPVVLVVGVVPNKESGFYGRHHILVLRRVSVWLPTVASVETRCGSFAVYEYKKGKRK